MSILKAVWESRVAITPPAVESEAGDGERDREMDHDHMLLVLREERGL